MRHDGKDLVIVMQELAAIPRKNVKQSIGNCSQLHAEVMTAIDLLFPGI